MQNKTIEKWEEKTFEKCIENIQYTNKIPKKDFKENGLYPIISQEEEYISGYWDNEKDLFKIKKPIVIFGDHTKNIKYVDFDFVLGADGVKIISTIDDILPKYMYYYLQNIQLRNLGYARHYKLLKEKHILYPKLSEQQRIVGILDEAFENIEKAKQNTLQNLNNAKELSDSYLNKVFTENTEDWEEKILGDILSLEYGKSLDKSERNEKGIYNAYGANGIKDKTNKYLYNKKSIIVGRKGSAGELNYTEEKFWALDVCYYVKFDEHKYGIRFLYNLLKLQNLPSLAKGVKPGINRNDVYNIRVRIPNIKKQQKIVQQLDELQEQTKKLEQIYTQKLQDLDELKQSILQKAFNGEL